MKTLLVVRHAKSSWSDLSLPDKARPLNGRGKRDVVTMGQRLVNRQVKPDLILISPAVRATETARAIAAEIGYEHDKIAVNNRLYFCQPQYWLDTVQALNNDLDYVMVVGHNPELNDFVSLFTDEIEHMPTCAMAEFKFEVNDWAEIGRDNMQAMLFDYPKKEG